MSEIKPSIPNPFPGLRPFLPKEQHLFYGRSKSVGELVGKLNDTRFIAILGYSGSGKSSLVDCGLLPVLEEDVARHWHVLKIRPGTDPLDNLKNGLMSLVNQADYPSLEAYITSDLKRSGRGLFEVVKKYLSIDRDNPLLIVVDQFEEIFQFLVKEDYFKKSGESAMFVGHLLQASEQENVPIYILLTMRSEFLGSCAKFTFLPEKVNKGQYLIPALDRDELREVIIGPLGLLEKDENKSQVDISYHALTQVMNDVEDSPDYLPVLQHLMHRVWNFAVNTEEPNHTVQFQHYKNAGKMSGALNKFADKLFIPFSDQKKNLCKRLFKAITERNENGFEVRRPCRLAELVEITGGDEKELRAIIEGYKKEGYLKVEGDEELVDISHESLIRQWERLKLWVDEEARDAIRYRDIAKDALQQELNQDTYYSGAKLITADDWWQRFEPISAWASRYDPAFERTKAFYETSLEQEDRRKERERRRIKQRQRIRTILTISVLLVMAGFTFFTVKVDNLTANLNELNNRSMALKEEIIEDSIAIALKELQFEAKEDSLNQAIDSLDSETLALASAIGAKQRQLSRQQAILASAKSELTTKSEELQTKNDELQRSTERLGKIEDNLKVTNNKLRKEKNKELAITTARTVPLLLARGQRTKALNGAIGAYNLMRFNEGSVDDQRIYDALFSVYRDKRERNELTQPYFPNGNSLSSYQLADLEVTTEGIFFVDWGDQINYWDFSEDEASFLTNIRSSNGSLMDVPLTVELINNRLYVGSQSGGVFKTDTSSLKEFADVLATNPPLTKKRISSIKKREFGGKETLIVTTGTSILAGTTGNRSRLELKSLVEESVILASSSHTLSNDFWLAWITTDSVKVNFYGTSSTVQSTLARPIDQPHSVAITRNQAHLFLAVGQDNGDIQIVELDGVSLEATNNYTLPSSFQEKVVSLEFGLHDRADMAPILAASGFDGYIMLWDLDKKGESQNLKLAYDNALFRSLEFRNVNNDLWLFGAGEKGVLMSWPSSSTIIYDILTKK